jgi:class 3 adenylate cyclase
MSPAPDSTLDDPQKIIARLQQQLAEAVAERDEALARETATAEVLGVINSSPSDLAPVFEAILDKAMQLCGAAIGELCTYDGERFATAAIRGETPAFIEARAMNPAAARPGTASRRVVETKRPVHILDMQIEAENRPAESRALIELSGIRTSLTVPLLRDETFLGFIRAYRREVKPFTDQQIALLEVFAGQAVIAIENARLITETREALEQQTATAEVLGVINSSPGDLAPVFDAILEKAHTLCDAATGSLRIIDGDMIRAVAFRGQSGEFADQVQQGYPFASAPLFASLRDGAPFVHISDVAERDDSISRLSTASGNRTILAVPLRKDDALLGMIVAGRKEVRPFTDKQIGLLRNFAAQAVIAMENARLLGELRARTHDLQESLEYQTATSDVLQVISRSTFDLEPVLQTVLETASRLCRADMAHIRRREGEVYRIVGSVSLEPAFDAFLRERYPATRAGRGSVVERCVLERRIIHVGDVANDPEYTVPEVVRIGRIRTALGVLLLREGEPIGLIALGRQHVEPFNDKEIELVRSFADQAVIAIENARLLGELRQRTEEVAELNRGLEARVAEQVEELGRVGRLKRFLAPQLAELIVSQGDEKILESHRREIVVVFCDLRGYTAFTETAEPEEVLDFLREYHGALGPLVSQFEGTLDQFSGDGIMVFFNDPVPCPDPAERAVKMATAMREQAAKLIATWRRDGCELGFGAGIAQGYATLGQIGFSERSGYTAIGTVCNLAARLCAEAKDGQILISSRVARAVEAVARLEDLGNLELKGLRRPVAAFNVVQSTSPAEARANLTVVGRGPGA